jgi:hypothetical protein
MYTYKLTFKKLVLLFLVFLMIFRPSSKMHSVDAVNLVNVPDLIIVRLYPDNPELIIGDAVTVEVMVENIGSTPSPESRVALNWCCGGIDRDVPPLQAGESVTIKFERSLVFTEARDYEITAVADNSRAINESNEENNTKTETIKVKLREKETPYTGEPQKWSGEIQPISDCSDNDLMKIGRKEPYVMEDSNHDDIPDRLSRETDPCYRDDDQENDLGCKVYLRGQKDNACGTTCLAYILRYFGFDVWPDDVDDAIRDSTAVAMFSEPVGIKEYAQSKRLNAEIYVNGDLEEVRSFVDRGIPVMLDISNTAGSTDINNGHWVTVVSFCEVPQELPSGTVQTVIGIYDPNGRQFSITPDRLEQFWGKMVFPVGEADVYLWNRLYIAISNQSLPPGNTDDVEEQLALANAIGTFMKGGEDIAKVFTEGEVWRLFEGITEVAGGIVTGIMSLISLVISWGEDIPLIGGFLGAVGEFVGNIAQVGEDLINGVADLLNPSNWLDPEKMGEIFVDILGAVVDGIVAVFEFIWDFIVDGIGGFFKSIIDGIKELGCDWFGWWCPDIVVYYKHFASTDPCLETTTFINGLHRMKALGYIYTYQAPDTKPIWLFAASRGEIKLTVHENDGLTVGDVNGDSKYAIIHGDRGDHKIYIFDTNGNQVGIPFNVGYEKGDGLSVGDVNGDGKGEIILADDSDDYIHIFKMDGTELNKFKNPLNIGKVDANDGLTVGDVNGDSKDEIVHGDRGDHKIYIFDTNGNQIGGVFDVGYQNGDGLSVGDVNGDGKDEIILADDSDDCIRIFDLNGTPLNILTGFPGMDKVDANDGLTVGDVNDDGKDEIVHGDLHDDKILIFDMNEHPIGSTFDVVGYEQQDRIAVGDVNGDGKDEIILADDSDDCIRIFDLNGASQMFFLSDNGNLSETDSNKINLGIIGYTLVSNSGNLIDLVLAAQSNGIYVEGNLGYLLPNPDQGTNILWLMRSINNMAKTISTDPCAFTQTFINPNAKNYTRELAVCLLPPSEIEDSQKLYRFYNPDSQDCVLSIDSTPINNYTNQGYIGYIYTEQKEGTVPLYQFYNNKRKDHLITLDINAESLSGYDAFEILGYVLPASDIKPEDWTCNVPLWRFCKRVVKEE